MNRATAWQPPLLWRTALRVAPLLMGRFARLEATSDVADLTSLAPAILACNHISPIDPFLVTAAAYKLGIAPRFMATGGIFDAKIVGPLMRKAGHIRVDRGKPTVTQAVDDAVVALEEGSLVLIYPEGRITLDPGLWPERGKTGVGRLALATGVPVIPMAIWGAHEVIPYGAPRNMWPRLRWSFKHKPPVRVHIGRPVDLSAVDPERVGAAQRATDLIIDAIVRTLAPLRADEPDAPRYRDPSRPQETRRTHRRTSA